MLLNASVLNSVVLNGGGSSTAAPHSGLPGSGRFVSDDELDLLLNGNYHTHCRVWIADVNGVLQDYSIRGDEDWTDGVELSGDIDAPISTASVKLWREDPVTGHSLAPFRSNSAWNADGAAIDAGRFLQIDVACLPLGDSPTDADWRVLFQGTTDEVDWEANPLTVTARDLGAQLADAFFVGVTTVGSEPALVQTRIQETLDSAGMLTAVDLNVPVAPDPAVYVSLYGTQVGPVMDAVQSLAQYNGWVLRYRWSDALQRFAFTFYDPGRDKTDPDFIIGPSQYITVSQMKIDRLDVRNDVTVTFRLDNDTGADRTSVRKADATSIARYGMRSVVINEADDSQVNSYESANLLAELVLFDLAEPKATKAVDMPFFWPVELHDLLRFPPNSVHSDDELNLFVVSIKHTIDNRQARTQLTTRGTGASSFWNWLRRRPARTPDPVPTPEGSPFFSNLRQAPDYVNDQIGLSFDVNADLLAITDHFVVLVQFGAYSDFGAGVSIGTSTSYTYTAPTDIEPPRAPTVETEQIVTVSFKVQAKFPAGFGYITLAESAVCTQTYLAIG